MGKILFLGPILAPLAQIWAQNIFSWIYLYYDCMQYQGKLRNQIL